MFKSKMLSVCVVATCALVLAAAVPASAGLLVSDDFNYTGSYETPPSGAPDLGWTGGTGFLGGSEWGVGYSGAVSPAPVVTASMVSGLTLNYFQSSGNALKIDMTSNAGVAMASRAVGVNVSSGDLWMSYLYQELQTGNTTTSDTLQFHTAAAGQFSNSASTRQFRSYPAWNNKLAVGGDAAAPVGGTDGTALRDGSTYLVVAKFSNIGVAGSAQVWGLTPAEYATATGNGNVALTESALTANAFSTVTQGSALAKTLASGDWLQLISYSALATDAANCVYDEFRMGTTLGDVIVMVAGPPVPEPSSLAIVVSGLLGLVAYAWRKRR